MTQKSPHKKKARALQERTGWAYQECHRCVTTMTPEAIEALISVRKGMVKQGIPPEHIDAMVSKMLANPEIEGDDQ